MQKQKHKNDTVEHTNIHISTFNAETWNQSFQPEIYLLPFVSCTISPVYIWRLYRVAPKNWNTSFWTP